jgi:hypothetical protein
MRSHRQQQATASVTPKEAEDMREFHSLGILTSDTNRRGD